jgi:carbonic anhydrase
VRRHKITKLVLSAFTCCAAVGLAFALPAIGSEKGQHWGYGTKNGPAHWAKLSPKFMTCGNGRVQSPIDVPVIKSSRTTRITFAYRAGPGTIVNNGHTIQIDVATGNVLTVGGERYELLQFHFHTPSENTIEGRRFQMEMHLVHRSAAGRLAVVAVMIQPGGAGHLIENLPKPAMSGHAMPIKEMAVNPIDLLPKIKEHYAFMGSLTTPPCSEGVRWFVMKKTIRISAATIKQLHAILGDNNRPVNPLNGRRVFAGK